MESPSNMLQSPEDTLKLIIIRRRNNCIDSIQDFKKFQYMGAEGFDYRIKVEVLGLYMELKSMIERKDKKLYAELKENHCAENVDTVIEAFYKMNCFLDSVGLTRLDRGM